MSADREGELAAIEVRYRPELGMLTDRDIGHRYALARKDIPTLTNMIRDQARTIRRLEAEGAGLEREVDQLKALREDDLDDRDAWQARAAAAEARVAELELDKSEVVGQLSLEHKALEASEAREAALRGALERIARNDVDLTQENGYARALWRTHNIAGETLATPAPAGGEDVAAEPDADYYRGCYEDALGDFWFLLSVIRKARDMVRTRGTTQIKTSELLDVLGRNDRDLLHGRAARDRGALVVLVAEEAAAILTWDASSGTPFDLEDQIRGKLRQGPGPEGA